MFLFRVAVSSSGVLLISVFWPDLSIDPISVSLFSVVEAVNGLRVVVVNVVECPDVKPASFLGLPLWGLATLEGILIKGFLIEVVKY